MNTMFAQHVWAIFGRMNKMEIIQRLLNEVTLISNKHDQVDQCTGRRFNVFKITNIADKEVPVCRIIYELINPKGSHFQKGKYLKLFCENVLDIRDATIDNCNKASVEREKVIDKDRRIDLYIKIADKEIPIEVKVYAGDQQRQCKDYYAYAKNSPIYYLTLDGHEPSCNSMDSLKKVEQLVFISFEKHILQWLGECLKDKETIKLSPIREILLQFEIVIRDLTGQMEEDKGMEIKELLSKSSENMKSAIDIEKNIESAKIDIMKKVFKEIEQGLNKETVSDYCSYKANDFKSCNEYYDTKYTKNRPGINYAWKTDSSDNVDIWLRVEIYNRICVGLYAAKNGEDAGKQLDEAEIKRLLGKLKPNCDGWRLYWQYLPDGGYIVEDENPTTPNFRNHNQAYYDLFDESKRKIFIDKCVKLINNLMEQANAN